MGKTMKTKDKQIRCGQSRTAYDCIFMQMCLWKCKKEGTEEVSAKQKYNKDNENMYNLRREETKQQPGWIWFPLQRT